MVVKCNGVEAVSTRSICIAVDSTTVTDCDMWHTWMIHVMVGDVFSHACMQDDVDYWSVISEWYGCPTAVTIGSMTHFQSTALSGQGQCAR